MGIFRASLEQLVPVENIPAPVAGDVGCFSFAYLGGKLAYATGDERAVVVDFPLCETQRCGPIAQTMLGRSVRAELSRRGGGVFEVKGSKLIHELRRDAGSMRLGGPEVLRHYIVDFGTCVFECASNEMKWRTVVRAPGEALLRALSTCGLTGLPLSASMRAALDLLTAGGTLVHAVRVDVVGLRRVNDYFGFPRGDEILAAVARVVDEQAGAAGGAAYRAGGDEFAVLAVGLDRERGESIAGSVVQAVRALGLEGPPGESGERTLVEVTAETVELRGSG